MLGFNWIRSDTFGYKGYNDDYDMEEVKEKGGVEDPETLVDHSKRFLGTTALLATDKEVSTVNRYLQRLYLSKNPILCRDSSVNDTINICYLVEGHKPNDDIDR